MRTTGVRLADGSMVWLDAGTLEITSLSQVTVRLVGGDTAGEVFVTPEAFLTSPPQVDGLVVESRSPRPADPDCSYLPGSEFPALGETIRHGSLQGIVIALDPVERRVTIAPGNGAPTVVPWDNHAGG